MPRRDDIRTILILGSGPIVIGQGCEFDYSGAQACKALRKEGYRVVLVNSNPATIMTDPAFSDRTYIEPVTPAAVRKVIARERESGTPIDAILPTLGGQTALNCACALWDDGTLQRERVEMIGASREVIHRAEDRAAFRRVCEGIGLRLPPAKAVTTMEDALAFLDEIGLPAIIRPSFTLGGAGGGVAYNREEFEEIVTRGLRASMIGQVQIDQSVLGWKEYELEVVRDRNDNCIIVCGIENIDAMGVHTGDSITVAPIQTLTDKEYQRMRDASIAIMRAVGVETGGSNVQFCVNPADGEMLVVEMNPRVSRSSALASKATGFPIAKIAAKLAVGYTLDELTNDVTGTTSACFEPSIDYVVVKMPRWTFEKFPEADQTLTTQMKSVGEAMAIGRTFKEALQKAIRSMEVKRFGLGLDRNDQWLMVTRAKHEADRGRLRNSDGEAMAWPIPEDKLTRKLAIPSQGRLYYIRYAFKMGWSVERVHALSKIDPWFLDQLQQLVEFESRLAAIARLEDAPADLLFDAKRLGYSDAQLANLWLGSINAQKILQVRARREALGVRPVFKLVDTCAAEFEALTPYYYSTYETGATLVDEAGRSTPVPPVDDARDPGREMVVILGGGPNRIGQGIEFDYCCVHAAYAGREMGLATVMINSNPETVSTDYDTSDLLFFEPLTLEDVLNVVERLNGGGPGGASGKGGPVRGVIVQFGGQTPLNLAHGLHAAGVPLVGTSLDSIDLAEDRKRFDALLERLKLHRPASGIAYALEEAISIAKRIGYPVLVRPSYVLGGRGMEVCPDEPALRQYVLRAVDISDFADAPVLIDRFLGDATEVDVDVVADFKPSVVERDLRDRASSPTSSSRSAGSESRPTTTGRAVICGVMEHIEQAGVHSGDSACAVPPYSLPPRVVERVRAICRDLARELRVCGLMNVQLAIKDDEVYILEVNPRASRTAPFVGKALGVSWPSVAAKVMLGRSLDDLEVEDIDAPGRYSVKAPVFPFNKFPGVDVALGPEMRSTGEVMGIDASFPVAFAKAMMGAGVDLPTSGNVFLSVREADRGRMVEVARALKQMGFGVYTSAGTGEFLATQGVRTHVLQKIAAGARPNVLDLLASGEIQLVINTPTRTGWSTDEGRIRATAVRLGAPMVTTATGALAAVRAIEALREGDWGVAALQDYAPAEPAHA